MAWLRRERGNANLLFGKPHPLLSLAPPTIKAYLPHNQQQSTRGFSFNFPSFQNVPSSSLWPADLRSGEPAVGERRCGQCKGSKATCLVAVQLMLVAEYSLLGILSGLLFFVTSCESHCGGAIRQQILLILYLIVLYCVALPKSLNFSISFGLPVKQG